MRRTGSTTARTTWCGRSSTPHGSLRSGRLVGHLRPDGSFDAAYCLLTAAGDLVSGECHSVPALDARGQIRIADHFRRSDGSTGVTYIEQIPTPVREA